MAELDLSGLGQFKNNHSKSDNRPKGGKPGFNKNNKFGGKSFEKDKKSDSYNSGNKFGNKSYSGNKYNGPQNGNAATYVGAPYNFVPFYNDVVSVPEEQMPVRGMVSEELYSGNISYTIKAETPIFVDDGTDKHDFFKNLNGDYAIPGSSFRGLIRSHAQVLGLASFDEDIDDYNLMFRKVGSRTSDPDKKRYDTLLGAGMAPIKQGQTTKQISVLKKVRGGYISNKNGKYYIYSTEVDFINSTFGEMNYYVLSERYIYTRKNDKEFRYFTKHANILQHDLSKGFQETGFGTRKDYKGTPNRDYKPGYYKVSYQVKNLKDICAVGEPGEYEKSGYLVATGKMNKKKALYIIPEMVEQNPIELTDKDIKAYEIDFEKKKNTLRTFGGPDKFALPEAGKTRPVFYISMPEQNRVYFGFTPRLRLFYDHSIKDGYNQTNRDGFDLVKSMFGCTGDLGSYKSKLSFSDAVVDMDKISRAKESSVVLGEPKPSSYMDYLDQSKDIVTYNYDFDLRGMKQYWLRPQVISGGDIKNDKVGSIIRGLSENTLFHGKIRFQNLTESELGLLLWCLRLEENSQINIGKAKAYGFGRCSIHDIVVNLVDYKKAYSVDQALDLNPFVSGDVNQFVEAYKEYMTELIGKDINKLDSVQTFFLMKDVTRMPDEAKIRYMKIDNKEYQNRTQPLPKARDVAKK